MAKRRNGEGARREMLGANILGANCSHKIDVSQLLNWRDFEPRSDGICNHECTRIDPNLPFISRKPSGLVFTCPAVAYRRRIRGELFGCREAALTPVRKTDAGLVCGKVFCVARHEQTIFGNCARPDDRVGKLEPIFPAQHDRFLCYFQRQR